MRVADKRSTARSRSGSEGTSDRALEAVRVRLLGGFCVSVGSRTIQQNTWRLRKAAALVKLLTLAPRHRLHREQVVEALWPDSGRKAASNRLRKTLHAARRALDPVEGSRYLVSENDSLVLGAGSSLWVDFEAFEEAAATARRGHDPAAYRAALDLYAGDLLPEDHYEEWTQERRQELRRTFLSLLIELATIHEERGECRQGAEALRRAVAEEPILEEAHAGLMRLYALLGQEAEALAQYERLRETLSKRLGTEPSSATERLRDEIASGEFTSALSSPASPPQEEGPPESSQHNLPAPRTSFVGREREMLEVKRELAMTRLLTLTGTGGSGKTRLALEVARSLVGVYPDGVWLVELAPLSEGALIPKAVARALGVKDRPSQPLSDTLAEDLRTKQALLVLDNCEHLVETVARLVDVLLDACPGVRVLATSREGLGIAGEMNWLVLSLSVPDPRQQPTAEELERYESVRLFVERARYRNPAFVLSPQNMQAVAQICERLDGIPLAIELAAARVGLSVEQIAARLDDSLRLLTTGSRTATARQQTLRGALNWSYDLLSESERVLFGRLSVFAGGWTLETAEVVGAGDYIEEGEVFALLLRLVDKSLVVVEASAGGEVRYRMLEPVRQYAQEKLEKNRETQAAERAHARYFLALSEEAEPELLGPRETQWYDRLEQEHDNIRVALARSLDRAEPELGVRLAGAIWWFWHRHGHLSEGLRWLDEGLTRGGGASAVARAKALGGVGWLAYGQGDIDRMKESVTEGLKLSSEAGLGGYHRALFVGVLGAASRQEGDYERATKLAEESLSLSRQANDMGGMANSLLILGTASMWGSGDLEQARAFYEEALAVSREFGSASILRSSLNSVALTYLLQRDLGRAKAHAEEAAALSQEAGDRTLLPLPLTTLGWVALLRGDLERAEALHKESLALSRGMGGSMGTLAFLEALACTAGAKGEAEKAARLIGAAEALREAMRVGPWAALRALEEPYLVGARSQLEEGTWAEAWEEGQKMSMEAAIEYALSEDDSSTIATRTQEQTSSATARTPALTRREREVAELVVRGRTNRQIALELFVSERTVDHHVSNILKKLDLSSREQVASRLAAH
jgi:predicted ATPase/DNA-binding SARP family transcriptional activator/DNA-binding CsgD family transcriptional regulator